MRWSSSKLWQPGERAAGSILLGTALVSLSSMTAPSPALAQTTLPEIVITSPSPVAPPTSASSASPETTESSSPTPGILIVADDAFVPVTVVTERDVLSARGATVTDSLQYKPGITGSTFAAGASRPVIRGQDNARVRVQENGIGTHDVATLSEDHAVPIDPNAAERVEVIRGPATLRYGSQAIGGVVSIENSRIPSFVPKNGFSGAIKGGLSSVDEGRDGGLSVTVGATGFAAHADAFVRRSGDYDTPDGRQRNTFVENEGFSVGLSRVWNDGYIGVSFTRNEAFYGIPGSSEEWEEAQPRIDLEQNKIQAKGEYRFRSASIEAVRFWFGATDYGHNEVIIDEGSDVVGTRFTNREIEGRVEVQHAPFRSSLGELRGAIGLQAGARKTQGFGVAEEIDDLLAPAKTRSFAGFIFEELQPTKRLRFQFAGRVERTSVEGRGLSDFSVPATPEFFDGTRTFTPVSGSIGALYEVSPGIVARVTAQHVERAPEAQELYSKGVHEATETFEIGNPFLKTERANAVELGLKKAAGALRFDGSIYYARYDNFIYKNFTGEGCEEFLSTCGGGGDLSQVQFLQQQATFYGVELSAQYDVASVWNGVWGIDGQYDFVRAKFKDDNVPRIPPQRLGGGIYYRDANLFARVGVLHAFKQDKINTEEIETPGYTLLNAEVSYTSKLSEAGSGTPLSAFTIGIKGENLADERVRNHSSFKRQDGVPLPGASVKVFGKVTFN